jgi:putative membrane protein
MAATAMARRAPSDDTASLLTTRVGTWLAVDPDAALAEQLMDPARLSALRDCDAALREYDPRSFWLIFQLSGRGAESVAFPMIGTTLWATAWGLGLIAAGGSTGGADAEAADGSDGSSTAAASARVVLAPLQQVFSPMLAAVSFLLVFRLSRAAVRYWDARAAAGKMVGVSRVLASEAAVCCTAAPDERRTLARWTAVFPVAVKNFLREGSEGAEGEFAGANLRSARRAELTPLLEATEVDALLAAKNQPLMVLNRLRTAAYGATTRAASGGGGTEAMRGQVFRGLSDSINVLTSAWGAMERINATPLPFVYVAHLRTFLVFYLLAASSAAVAEWGLAALPALVAMSWALLGIEAAAVECERPFGRQPHHLSLGRFCVTAAENVAQTLQETQSGGSQETAGGGGNAG